jgi:hypothetical protein
VLAPTIDVPPSRRLRVYAFDPSLAHRLQTAAIQEITIRVPWDHDPDRGKLGPKPKPWRHPLPSIKQALHQKCQGRVFQTDTAGFDPPADESDVD